jgi:hypothetical protein
MTLLREASQLNWLVKSVSGISGLFNQIEERGSNLGRCQQADAFLKPKEWPISRAF